MTFPGSFRQKITSENALLGLKNLFIATYSLSLHKEDATSFCAHPEFYQNVIMEKWYKVAAYMAGVLARSKGVDRIDLLTLNKVMYFAQRESYILNDKPLFETDKFHAAQFGPVIIELKERLANNRLTELPSAEWINRNKPLLDYVSEHYGVMSPSTLSTLSHCEISWRNARDRARARGEQKYEVILDRDIKIDALKIRIREKKLGLK